MKTTERHFTENVERKKEKTFENMLEKEKKKGTFCFTITEEEGERFPICFQSHPVR